MDYAILEFVLTIVNSMAIIAIIAFLLSLRFKKPNIKASCIYCGSAKIVALINEPGAMYCNKCHKMFKTEQKQETIKHICKYCNMELADQEKLKKHIVTKHLDQINL